MNKIKVYAYKHNGDFHRLWHESEILLETKDYFITKTDSRIKVSEQEDQFWYTREPAVCYFSKKRWFNIIIIYKKDNEVLYYCNIASPILKELNSLKYIDYDLDLKYFVATKKIKFLDRKEYLENKEIYNYPEWITVKIEKELKILQTWAKNEIGPFSKEFRDKMYEEQIKE